ncbi:hypothetical protein [Holophaga foetida]|uniref:hypothetical protein n=1 Tax=Holophaga foetida TaxID=35839 RepID=UPI00024717A3|nr:hypothetical protein [Holophaga foetida]
MLKRQTLIMAAAFVAVILGMGIPLWIQRPALLPSGPSRSVAFGGAALEVPEAFGAPVSSRFENWERRTLSGRSGLLLLAWEPADPRPLSQAYAQWFDMPAYTRGPVRYESSGFRWFYREIPLFGQGAYALQKRSRGKGLRLITCFSQNGNHYWIQLDVPNPSTQAQRAFHAMLLTLKLPDGSRPEPTLAAALEGIPRECGWRFTLPMGLPFLLPLAVLALVFGIQVMVRKRSSRMPDQPSGYMESGLEIAFSRPMQIQYLDVAIGVTGEALTLYTFGTPFLVIPRASMTGRVTTGQGWFGAKYVQLDLEGPLDLRKYKWKYRADRGARIRIYTPDETRLYHTLMS